MSKKQSSRKASSVRHTRAIQRDHTKHTISAPTADQVQERLTAIVHPATLAQVAYVHSLGLRERTLGLVVMVAYVLGLIWRQISGVSEMVRLIQTEAVLWAAPRKVSQQALSLRLSSLPSELFLNGLLSILPCLQQRWAERQRPLAGRITGLLNLGSRLPSRIGYEPDPHAHDQRCWPQIVAVLKANALLVFDMGYVNFEVFVQLTQAQVKFITRAKSNLA